MGAPFSTLSDLKAHWPGLPEYLEDEAVQKLAEASIEIRGLYPDIDARLKAGAIGAGVVGLVVNRMVKRALEQPADEMPAGLTQFQTTVGPFAQSMSFSGRDGAVYLTRADRNLLAPKKVERKAWTIEVA